MLDSLNKQLNKALKIVMNIDFQELNAKYLSEDFHKALEIFQESLAAIGKSITNMMSEYVKQIQLVQTVPIVDTMRRIKESIGLPLTPYPNISYLNKKNDKI